MAQISGAAVAPMIANGRAEAKGPTPKSARNGTWTMDANGIQWALDGMGSDGSGGMPPPTSGKIQMKSMLKPSPACRLFATST